MAKFDVVIDELLHHAKFIDSSVQSLHQASDLVHALRVDRGAYGILGQAIPPLLDGMETREAAVLQNLTKMQATSAQQLREAIAMYRKGDETTAALFRYATP